MGSQHTLASLVKSWLDPKTTVLGKELIKSVDTDSFAKTIMVYIKCTKCMVNEALASPKANELTIPEQMATGKGTSNPLMSEPELPSPNETIRNSPASKIGIATVGLFRKFCCNSISNGWLSFENRKGSDTPCCYIKNLDSLKKWNDHFIWVKLYVVPIFVPWFEGSSVEKDPPLSNDIVDFGLIEVLNENRAGFKKYLEVFLCVFGLSRAYDDEDVRPTFLDANNKEMRLFDFIKSSDPFKMKVRERTLANGEESMTPSPDHEYRDESDSVQQGGTGTRPANQRFVVISSESPSIEPLNTESPSSLKSLSDSLHVQTEVVAMVSLPVHEVWTSFTAPVEASPVDAFYESQIIDSAKAKDVYILNWNITNDFKLDDDVVLFLLNTNPNTYYLLLKLINKD
ncbi:hypothetical protein Tco_1517862 [Tanacetum coccineum]